jgi:hypothetical protein
VAREQTSAPVSVRREPLEFPSVKEIAEAKALARLCKHRVMRRRPGSERCLQCGSERHGTRWSAPLRVPRLRRIK